MNIVEQVKVKRGRRSKKDILKAEEEKKQLEEKQQQEKQEVVENTVINETILLVEEMKIESSMVVGEELEEQEQEQEQEGEEINVDSSTDIVEGENAIIKPPAKKRGRKPKGGKIIQQNLQDYNQKVEKPNIILHLKCSMKDLHNSEIETNYNNPVDSFHFSTSKNELSYEVISKPEFMNDSDLCYNSQNNHNSHNSTGDLLCGETMFDNNTASSSQTDSKEIWRKLKILEKSLHLNDISDKKSACFWCSYDFDNTPIYIPKFFVKNSYHVYGCFCTPECAVAHLMNENIDSSTKFERYHLINYIYSKIYEYKKNIKPAPDPYYMLDRYYGNLTIQEYRALLKSERLFLIVDKPLTRILPELHEDNDEFIINNKIIPSSNNFQVKKKIQKKPQNKSSILNEKFGGLQAEY